ncbi:putative endopeptidase Clp, partial [Emiliania huxleyi CCMP1516]|uniref:ATP-dependent Clp protease proteolytic subunit n=2 Tax=Emiliania huxleyi TaxID=2903 RepID=A0A0D3J253_EMIH1
IDDESAKSVVALLLYLEGAEPGAPITLLINSGGGKVQAGLAIHDVMRSLSSPVHTACLGHCESMAAVLLAAGEQGHRTALPNSRIMVHQPTRRSAGGQSKTSRQLQISAEETEKSRLKLAECLARDTGKTLPEIEALLENDSYYSAAEARAMGLVDVV